MMTRWAIRDGGVGRVVFCAGLMLLAIGAVAQPAPPGPTQTDRVIQVHREVASAVVEVRYGVYFTRIDETEFVTSEYRITFDRPSNRLRIDRPGYTLVSDGTDILLVAEALPGRHLRMPLDGALTYDRLVGVFPDLANPTAPALLYLFDDDPVAQFAEGQVKNASQLHPAQTDQIHLAYPLSQGRHTQRFNGESRLIEQVLIDLDVKRQDLEAARFHYAFDWSQVDEPIADAEFVLDLKQSQEMTTLAAFLSPNGGNAQQNPGGPGGQGGGGAAGNTLIGMPLPEIELNVLGSDEKVKLSELDKGVVILEFFATWSKTSVLDLPALAEFKSWCKENKHEVRVYGIAVGDQPDYLTKWIEALEKTAKKEVALPMLMDTSIKAAEAMKLPTVPRTLIVVDGRVVDVYGGVKPTYLDDLKEGMPGWLEKVKAEEAGAAN